MELRVRKYKRLIFRSFNDLNEVIIQNYKKLDPDFDLIVGVPRSGIIPASIISLLLNKPFSTFTEFSNGLLPNGGQRISGFEGDIKKILIVDDSVNSGKEIERVKEIIRLGNFPKMKFSYLGIYITNSSVGKVDFFFQIIDNPRIFEWNLIHSWIFSRACVDIDGVLCLDPSDEENDDSYRYIEFLKNARPKILPKVPIKILVTNRLEKYRDETEYWLKNNGVEYERLFMGPWNSKEERQAKNEYGSFKAEIYLKYQKETLLFIESSVDQSVEINRISKLPVFCTDNMKLYDNYVHEDKFRFLLKEILNKFWRFVGVEN